MNLKTHCLFLVVVGLAAGRAPAFEKIAIIDSFDFASVYDTETVAGTEQILDHVLLTGADTVLWRNCSGATMRYRSQEESPLLMEAPFDPRRVPQDEAGVGRGDSAGAVHVAQQHIRHRVFIRRSRNGLRRLRLCRRLRRLRFPRRLRRRFRLRGLRRGGFFRLGRLRFRRVRLCRRVALRPYGVERRVLVRGIFRAGSVIRILRIGAQRPADKGISVAVRRFFGKLQRKPRNLRL